MEKEVNLKYLYWEIIRNWKSIIAVGIIVAIIAGVYGILGNKVVKTEQVYGSFSKIAAEIETEELIFDDAVGADGSSIIKVRDYGEENISIVNSDKVLQQVANDSEISDYNLTLEKIRSMMYPRAKADGRIIEINVVTGNEDIASVVCEKVTKYASVALSDKGYKVELMQGTTNLGTVAIETVISNDKSKSFTIVSPKATPNYFIDILKKMVIGSIACMLLTMAYICIMFVFRDRIIYASQIEDYDSIRIISDFSKENNYLQLYSAVNLEDEFISTMNFISLKETKKIVPLVEEFAQLMGTANKRVAVIKYTQGIASNEDFVFVNKNNYDYAEISEILLLQKGLFNSKNTELKKIYDLIFYVCDGLDKNPVGKLISKETDETIITVETNTIKTNELFDIVHEFEQAGLKIAGTIFVK